MTLTGLMSSGYSLTLEKLLSRARTVHPKQEIVSRMADQSIHRYTFNEFYGRVIRLMNALRDLGVRPGDRVATYAWNNYRHMELYFAIPCMGAVLHTLNIRLPAEKLGEIIDHGEDTFIFVDKSLAAPVLGLAERLSTVKKIVVMDDLAPASALDFSETLDYEALIAAASDEENFPDLEETQAAALCYTSGTTGESKGVLYDHRSLCLHSMALCMADGPALSMQDNVLLVVPMFHVNGWCIPYATCLAGNKIVFPGPHLLGTPLAEQIQDEQITFALGIPSIWLLLYKTLCSGKYKVPALKRLLVGGAAMPQSSIEDYRRELGIHVMHAWGMTETTPFGSASRLKSSMEDWPEEKKFAQLAKQGLPAPLIELKIIDGDGAELARDGKAFGELLIRGPWVAANYFKYDAPEGESPFAGDNWFHTGDIATIDEHGYMEIVDRKKDLIKTRGEWVSSVAMENYAVSHPAVVEAAVVGRPDELRGEAVVLFVVLNADDAQPTSADLSNHLAKSFENWQLPKQKDIHIVDAIPKTTVGKIDKKLLRSQLLRQND